MTDAEIINLLEFCITSETCVGCPMEHNCPSAFGVMKLALDLVNKQKTEIETLQTVNADMHESLRLASEANKDMQAEVKTLKEGVDNG